MRTAVLTVARGCGVIESVYPRTGVFEVPTLGDPTERYWLAGRVPAPNPTSRSGNGA